MSVLFAAPSTPPVLPSLRPLQAFLTFLGDVFPFPHSFRYIIPLSLIRKTTSTCFLTFLPCLFPPLSPPSLYTTRIDSLFFPSSSFALYNFRYSEESKKKKGRSSTTIFSFTLFLFSVLSVSASTTITIAITIYSFAAYTT